MSIERAISGMLTLLYVALAFIPFGIWKVVELIIWTFTHVKIE